MRRTLTPANSPVSSPSKHGDRFIPSRAGANWSVNFHRINVRGGPAGGAVPGPRGGGASPLPALPPAGEREVAQPEPQSQGRHLGQRQRSVGEEPPLAPSHTHEGHPCSPCPAHLLPIPSPSRPLPHPCSPASPAPADGLAYSALLKNELLGAGIEKVQDPQTEDRRLQPSTPEKKGLFTVSPAHSSSPHPSPQRVRNTRARLDTVPRTC